MPSLHYKVQAVLQARGVADTGGVEICQVGKKAPSIVGWDETVYGPLPSEAELEAVTAAAAELEKADVERAADQARADAAEDDDFAAKVAALKAGKTLTNEEASVVLRRLVGG